MNINDATPSKYLKAHDLKGAAVNVTVHQVKMELVGLKKDQKAVVYFMGKDKGLVLNKINGRKIAEIAGSDETDDWGGTVVTLYPTETEYQGDTVDCIRVKAPNRNGAARQPAPPPPTAAAEVTDDDIQF